MVTPLYINIHKGKVEGDAAQGKFPPNHPNFPQKTFPSLINDMKIEGKDKLKLLLVR
jgi:hypothetical protein